MFEETKMLQSAINKIVIRPLPIKKIHQNFEDDIDQYIVEHIEKNDLMTIEDMVDAVIQQRDLMDKLIGRVIDNVSFAAIHNKVKHEWSLQ